jgi:hypothetical protein
MVVLSNTVSSAEYTTQQINSDKEQLINLYGGEDGITIIVSLANELKEEVVGINATASSQIISANIELE